MNKFAVLASVSDRTFTYLSIFKNANLNPRLIILYGDDRNTNLYKKIKNKFNNIKFIKSKIASNKKIKQLLSSIKVELIIYIGFPGEILKIKFFNNLKVKFLHSHTGFLPNFKGSTTIYYSILSLGKIYCSTFIMSEKIDDGEIILIKEYPLPKKETTIEKDYDNEIRAKNFVYLFKGGVFKKINGMKKGNEYKSYYYIAHPVLRNLTLKKIRKIRG